MSIVVHNEQSSLDELVVIVFHHCISSVGYWHQRADEGHGNSPQGNQELLMVRDKVGRSHVSLG